MLCTDAQRKAHVASNVLLSFLVLFCLPAGAGRTEVSCLSGSAQVSGRPSGPAQSAYPNGKAGCTNAAQRALGGDSWQVMTSSIADNVAKMRLGVSKVSSTRVAQADADANEPPSTPHSPDTSQSRRHWSKRPAGSWYNGLNNLLLYRQHMGHCDVEETYSAELQMLCNRHDERNMPCLCQSVRKDEDARMSASNCKAGNFTKCCAGKRQATDAVGGGSGPPPRSSFATAGMRKEGLVRGGAGGAANGMGSGVGAGEGAGGEGAAVKGGAWKRSPGRPRLQGVDRRVSSAHKQYWVGKR